MKKNLLVTLADENYVEYAKQLFSSVYWNAGWRGDYMLLAYNIPEKKLKWFRDKGILIKKCNLSSKQKEGKWPPVILNKFCLFKTEFKKWGNIVFLDVDIIVRASLDDLAIIKGLAAPKGHDKLITMCHSPLYLKISGRDAKRLNELKKKYNLDGESLNAGVLAFSTDIIKRETFDDLKKLTERYIELSNSIDELPMSILFYGKWKKLPVVYNLCPGRLRQECSIRPGDIKGIILHFILDSDPWNKKSFFHKEWKCNLEKAESIDLKKSRKPAKTWTKEEIISYSMHIKKRKKIFFYKAIALKAVLFADRRIGFIGLLLKRFSPRARYLLNKIKEKWNLKFVPFS
jgi:lipopolysaccharide biosynthesis glycosyltransferase